MSLYELCAFQEYVFDDTHERSSCVMSGRKGLTKSKRLSLLVESEVGGENKERVQ